MKAIRKLIYSFFGLRGYLFVVSKIYLFLIKCQFLKRNYPELFFLRKIIKPGFVCIDIGANVGYYSYFLCKYSGKNGIVYAVEPIPEFRSVLIKNIPSGFHKKLHILPYALGDKETIIQMGIPIVDGVIHHGMTHILNRQHPSQIAKTFDVEMKIPDKLFYSLDKIDFIKCDVEGYEYFVFSNMQETLKKHKPIIQCELGSNFKNATVSLLKSLGYEIYKLEKQSLSKLIEQEILNYPNDVYFIPVGKS